MSDRTCCHESGTVRRSRARVVGPAALLVSTFGLLVGVATHLPNVRAAETTTRPALDPIREYRERFAQLGDKDVEGHYALAEWCRRQKQYRLLLRQANYVLHLDPDHENAKLLVSIAYKHLEAARDQEPSDAGPEAVPGGITDPDYVTRKDIQKLRFAELQDLPVFREERKPSEPIGRPGRRLPERRPKAIPREFVQVRFGPRVLHDFVDRMSGHENFSEREQREWFFDQPPTEQLQIIRHYSGATYADRIEIASDPLSFRKFRRVQPLIIKGCGTTGCHVGADAAKPFRLRTGRLATAPTLYANFLVLDRTRVGKNFMIDRASPEDSLLLQYGLPENFAYIRHSTEIPALFLRGLDDPKYRTVLDWIETLRFPRPRTGVELEGYPELPPPGALIGSPREAEGGAPPAGRP